MSKRISVRDEYLHISDERTLDLIIDMLREEFLFLRLEDYAIEVHEQDHEPLRQRLVAIKQDLHQCSPALAPQ